MMFRAPHPLASYGDQRLLINPGKTYKNVLNFVVSQNDLKTGINHIGGIKQLKAENITLTVHIKS